MRWAREWVLYCDLLQMFIRQEFIITWGNYILGQCGLG